MTIEDVLHSLTLIKQNLEEIPLLIEEDGLSAGMFTLGSTTTALQSLIDVMLLNKIDGMEEIE